MSKAHPHVLRLAVVARGTVAHFRSAAARARAERALGRAVSGPADLTSLVASGAVAPALVRQATVIQCTHAWVPRFLRSARIPWEKLKIIDAIYLQAARR
jgi:hypothetical protein